MKIKYFPVYPELFIEIFLIFVLLLILEKILNFRKLLAFLLFFSNLCKTNRKINIHKAVIYVEFMLDFFKIRKTLCLKRSYILFYLLRNRNIDVGISFGIKQERNLLNGHAWLIKDGQPYLENNIHLRKEFSQIFLYP